MPRLFSYVVHHDFGTSPNPYGGYCTLALCKFGSAGHPNVIELAERGDWVAGTGGVGPSSTGSHGKLVYAMRVDEKLDLADYSEEARFNGRPDTLADPSAYPGRFALVSRHYFYFGSGAIDLAEIPSRHLASPFVKHGPGFRYKDFSPEFVDDFAEWLAATYRVGVHGVPCGGLPAHAPRRHRLSRNKVQQGLGGTVIRLPCHSSMVSTP